MIRHVAEDQNFSVAVLQSNKKLVLVDFWAPWCKPCQAMEPVMESISRRFTSLLDIVKVNVDDAADIAKASNVSSIPTLLFYQSGKVVKVEIGMKDENYLTGVITELLKNQL